ncbi:MAG: hypothetical protein IPN88_07170 [Bacteroidetes bacterium]|nr:hypothetical protein [Bacteroidota bacterium]
MKKYYSEYSGENTTVTRYVLDSLHRIINDGNQFYEYDSLDRIVKHGVYSSYDSIVFSNPPGLIEDYLFQQSSSLELVRLIQRFLGANQKDSITYSYIYTSGILTSQNRNVYSYFLSDSLSVILTQQFDTVSMIYTTIDSSVYIWSPDYLFKTVNHYDLYTGMFQAYRVDSVRYNSSGEIVMSYSTGSYGAPGFRINYWNECGVPYETSYVTVGGSGQIIIDLIGIGF